MMNQPEKFSIGLFPSYGSVISCDGPYSVKPRGDLLSLLPADVEIASICELGCADGTNLRYFGRHFSVPHSELVGVDICRSERIDVSNFNFVHSSVEAWLATSSERYDLIILSDVLEHLYNPWVVLRAIRERVTNDGRVLISVPNIRNLRYAQAVISGRFLYQKTGLFDETHIRFFSHESIAFYLRELGFSVERVGYRPDLSIEYIKKQLLPEITQNGSAALKISGAKIEVSLKNIEEFFAQQVLVSARVDSCSSAKN
jgi:SAM-dependent methyltransferase